MTTPVPVQGLQFSHAPVAEERNVVPAEQVGDGKMTDPDVVQLKHTPLQAIEVRPAELPNVPAGQATHEEAPAREYVPGEQRLQIVEPGDDHEPAAQGVHDAVLPTADLKVPAGHTVQASDKVLAIAPAFAK